MIKVKGVHRKGVAKLNDLILVSIYKSKKKKKNIKYKKYLALIISVKKKNQKKRW
jgi:ribosomal protein L14